MTFHLVRKIREIFKEGRSEQEDDNLTNGIDKLTSYRVDRVASRFSHHPVTALSARYRVSQGVACNPWTTVASNESCAARISSARAGNKTREEEAALYSQRVKHRLGACNIERVPRPSTFHRRTHPLSRATTRAFMQNAAALPSLSSSNTVFLDLATRIVAAPMFNRFDRSTNRSIFFTHRLETTIVKTMTTIEEVKKFLTFHEGEL